MKIILNIFQCEYYVVRQLAVPKKLKGGMDMKLVLAIVHDDDGNKLMSELNKQGFSVTKLATTGGFLRAGNMTLLVGTSKENVQTVIDIIKSKCWNNM